MKIQIFSIMLFSAYIAAEVPILFLFNDSHSMKQKYVTPFGLKNAQQNIQQSLLKGARERSRYVKQYEKSRQAFIKDINQQINRIPLLITYPHYLWVKGLEKLAVPEFKSIHNTSSAHSQAPGSSLLQPIASTIASLFGYVRGSAKEQISNNKKLLEAPPQTTLATSSTSETKKKTSGEINPVPHRYSYKISKKFAQKLLEPVDLSIQLLNNKLRTRGSITQNLMTRLPNEHYQKFGRLLNQEDSNDLTPAEIFNNLKGYCEEQRECIIAAAHKKYYTSFFAQTFVAQSKEDAETMAYRSIKENIKKLEKEFSLNNFTPTHVTDATCKEYLEDLELIETTIRKIVPTASA